MELFINSSSFLGFVSKAKFSPLPFIWCSNLQLFIQFAASLLSWSSHTLKHVANSQRFFSCRLKKLIKKIWNAWLFWRFYGKDICLDYTCMYILEHACRLPLAFLGRRCVHRGVAACTDQWQRIRRWLWSLLETQLSVAQTLSTSLNK